MVDDKESDLHRALRAEVILIAAIAVVLLLVAVLGGVLMNADRAHEVEAEVVARVRAARNEMMAVSQAQADAEAIANRYAATSSAALLPELESARAESIRRLSALRELIAGDEEALAITGRIERIVDERIDTFAEETEAAPGTLPAGRPARALYSAFRSDTAAFHDVMNGRIDEARAAQREARIQLNTVAVTLALLSLIASGLAIFALRRERRQWRLAQAAAEDARARAAAADMAKSRFLAVASHDMRQPLHALTLYLSALERRVETPEARDIIAKMERATQSMIGMFSMLLDLARVQAGVITPEITNAALEPVFERLAAGHATGVVEVASTPLAVYTDPVLLERILANLLSNAVKHGGGKARLSATAEGAYVQIEVADDGPGIALEDQTRIFDEFVRLKTQNDGLGLGLAIVRRLAERLDVAVAIDSAPGRGSRFTVRVKAAIAAHASAPETNEKCALSGAVVIVLDDDALAREAAAGALRDLGADVSTCASEAELDRLLAQGRRPSLILMDLRVDGALQGVDIANRARSKLDPPPPVIVVTGDTGADTLAMLRRSGYAWLIKPVNPNALAQTASAQISAQRTRATGT